MSQLDDFLPTEEDLIDMAVGELAEEVEREKSKPDKEASGKEPVDPTDYLVNLEARIDAIEQMPNPDQVAESALAIYFEMDSVSKQLSELADKVKGIVSDLMGELGKLDLEGEAGSVKLIKAGVTTRLDTKAVTRLRKSDPKFDAIMTNLEKKSERAASLRFTSKK